MKRGRPPANQEISVSVETLAKLQVLSALTDRASLAARLGYQYGGDRDIYQALGYPMSYNITYVDYVSRYTRQDIAKAVIDRPISYTWKGDVNITEVGVENDTQLEKAWKDLEKELKLKSKFVRLDKLSCIGEYGILLLGFSDVTKPEDMSSPVKSGGKNKLLYVRPLGQGHAEIAAYEKNPKDPRYGKPLMYDITITDPENASTESTAIALKVHHSRILHIVPTMLESEVEGEPVLKGIWNRLIDLEKLVGGSAEMFWRGARPGFQGKLDKDFKLSTTMEADLKAQIDEYEHNLRRMLFNEGVNFEALDTQISDPEKHVDIQIQMISAVTGIPKRILTGSERGELASTQDLTSWYSVVQTRREEYAEHVIIRPFVDRMIELGVLPKPSTDEYQIEWEDLFASSDKEQAEVGKLRAEALKAYTTNSSAQVLVPPEAFLDYFLGLDDDQIEHLTELMEAAMIEEEKEIEENRKLAEKIAAGGGPQNGVPPGQQPGQPPPAPGNNGQQQQPI